MRSFTIILTLAAVMGTTGILSAQPIDNGTGVMMPSSQSAITFRLALRELWQYQVTWTRSYIVSVLSDLEDINIVEDKLVKNQEKIGNAVKPYYGGIAGNRLAVLLREHIVIAVEIVRAQKAKNDQALKKARDKGRDNADQISNLLSRAKNLLWDKSYLKDMFYNHLEYINRQVDFRLKKDWTAEIKAYDDGLQHVLRLADILAEGIIHQFPDKFKE